MTRSLVALFLCVLLIAPVTGEAQQGRRRSSRRATAAKNPRQLRSQLQGVRRRRQALHRELVKTQAAAREVKETITIVDARLERIETDLDHTAARLSDSRSEQRELTTRLSETTARLDQVREQVRRRIRQLYLRQEGSYVSALMGARSVSDLLSRQQISQAIVQRDRQMFEEFRTLQRDVADRKRRQDQLVADIRELRSRQERHQGQLASTRQEKQEILGDLRARQGELKRLINQLAADEADISSQIAAFARRSRPPGSRPLPPMIGSFLRPAHGPITSGFGMRYHPILHYTRMHKGIDIGAPAGSAIYAAADGEVVSARYSSSYGNVIILAHGSGLSTVYAHCSRIFVSAGQAVRRGQRIGAVGSTGLAKGPHLHWEVYLNGRAINPLSR